jgi:hypothetical protein
VETVPHRPGEGKIVTRICDLDRNRTDPIVREGGMPRRNRVTPFGEIVAVPDRGTLTGNRGILHDAAGEVRRAWNGKRWIACTLDFPGSQHAVMAPGHYTHLFFLDEAAALAAGHRPCAFCRREQFRAFRVAWGSDPSADEMDTTLHAERVGLDRKKVRFAADLGELPDGVLVTRDEDDEAAWLVWAGELLRWSSGGYADRRPRPKGGRVSVLTPASVVRVLAAGYVPGVHPSARTIPA